MLVYILQHFIYIHLYKYFLISHLHPSHTHTLQPKTHPLLPLYLLSLFSLFPGDRTKPEIRSCPRDQTVNAIPIQRHAFVDWAPPTAWDNRDGQVRYEYMMILMFRQIS